MSSYVETFKKISKKDVLQAGGKGASLGEMTGAGIPVPPGFVLLSSAFDKFLAETDLKVELDAILDNVDHEVVSAVDDASGDIRSLIMNAEMPGEIAKEIVAAHKKLDARFVAVRSSATAEDSADAAWAGQLESYLNTREDQLLDKVKECWASLFTPRAIFYGFEKGFHSHEGEEGDEEHKGKAISVAVVVQKMVESRVSGIAFSVHPVTQDRDQLIIEAGFGLGEAIVQGAITPDSYVVEKSTKQILDKNISVQEKGMYKKRIKKQELRSKDDDGEPNEWRDIPVSEGEKATLSDEEVLELFELIIKIEEHYGFPVDVEWAREGGEFYIVQSRPITTL